MISEHIARRYVKALFEAAQSTGDAAALSPLLQQLQELFRDHQDLRTALTNPQLPDQKKRSLLAQVVGGDIPPLLQRFLTLLLAKRRLDVLEAAGTVYKELLDETAGVRHGQVITALPLSPDHQQRLTEALSRKFGGQVVLETVIDPAVIGGVAVRVGDVLIDGTLQRRLADLKERFAGANRASRRQI